MSEPVPSEEDCAEGCSGDHVHKWEISPHPYNSGDFDTFVTDSDFVAAQAIKDLAEQQWDACEPGETRTIKITHNKVTA